MMIATERGIPQARAISQVDAGGGRAAPLRARSRMRLTRRAALGGAGRRPRLRPYSANMNAPCVRAHPPIAGSILKRLSDFRDLGFLALQELVDPGHVLVRELLDAIFRAVLLVGANLCSSLRWWITSRRGVPHGDPALLRDLTGDLHELLAALLRELRDRQADDLAVVRRVEPGSDSWIARSIAPRSSGRTAERSASAARGTFSVASWFSGVCWP